MKDSKYLFIIRHSFVQFWAFANHVSGLMQLKKLNLKKNNWSSESYKFDEVFTESASQKRIYEVVAKPVVEVFLYMFV